MMPRGSEVSQVEARRAMRVYLWVFCVLSAVGWLPEILGRSGTRWVSTEYSALLHTTDTFSTVHSFEDLTDFTGNANHRFGGRVSDRLGPFPYPPAAAFVFAFFLRCHDPVFVYLVGFAVTLAGLGTVVLWRLGWGRPGWWTWAVVLTVLLGGPQWFTADRANLEWVNCGLTCFGVIAIVKRRYLPAGILFGLAASIKPFPVVFFILLLWRRRYLEVAVGLATTAAASVVALFALGPSVSRAMRGISKAGKDYFDDHVLVVLRAHEFRFYHSILDSIKVALWFVFDHQTFDLRRLTAGVPGIPIWARIDLWAHGIVVFSVLSVGWIVWRFARMPMINGIFALTIAELLLPYSSAEYTMLLLYLPWALLLVAMAEDVRAGRLQMSVSSLVRLLIPCAVLFTPLSFMGCLSGVTKTVMLFYLFVQVCRIPMPSSLFGELPELARGDA